MPEGDGREAFTTSVQYERRYTSDVNEAATERELLRAMSDAVLAVSSG